MDTSFKRDFWSCCFFGLVKIRMSEYYSKIEDVDIDSILESMSYHEKLPVSEKHETCF